jgi:hypothetical protein
LTIEKKGSTELRMKLEVRNGVGRQGCGIAKTEISKSFVDSLQQTPHSRVSIYNELHDKDQEASYIDVLMQLFEL